jgi:MFS family permease
LGTVATPIEAAGDIDGRAAWLRLLAALAVGAVGCTGMWSHMVALPSIQAEFQVGRSEAALPYTLAMMGFGLGGIVMGRIMDRLGVLFAIVLGIALLSTGYIAAGLSRTLWQYALSYGLLIGLGTSAMFAPLMADISHWFHKRRGIAVSVCSCGNALSGAIWPPILQHFISTEGWRGTHIGYGVFAAAFLLPLCLAFRRRAPKVALGSAAAAAFTPKHISVSPGALQWLLMIAGVGCCVAMATPQVHIVAYCSDLGYGAARGAEMLAVMLLMAVVSRLFAGFIADRIGAMETLILGSILQAVTLLLYLPYDGLVSLYVVSALFGLFQGGIIPMYAVVVRDFYPPKEAGQRVGTVIMATLVGMAFGGWVSGYIFDQTGSYLAAFGNGFVWNLMNIAIIAFLIWSTRRGRGLVTAPAGR